MLVVKILGAIFFSLPAFSAVEIFRETFESDEEKIISFDRLNVSAIQILSQMTCKVANFIAYKQESAYKTGKISQENGLFIMN